MKIRSWESLYTDWLDSPETEVEIVHFEQLTSSPKEMKSVLRRVTKFLGLQREMEELRLRCVEEHSEGRFHRMKKKEGEEGGETSSQRYYKQDYFRFPMRNHVSFFTKKKIRSRY